LAFQYCYLDDEKANNYFVDLFDLEGGDYSRYLFFYISNLISKKEYDTVKLVSLKIEPITSTLLILQSKNWIEENNLDSFSKIFSCKSENDILAEIFFLISNLYSSQEDYNMSNYYLNISNYLNPKFKFNLSLAIENYYLMNKDVEIKKVLKNFDVKDGIYYWYRIKKEYEILKEVEGGKKSLNFLNSKFKNLKIKSPKIYFDLGNIYKNLKEYNKSIENYNFALESINKESESYADILYRRGGSYERLKDYEKADKDLLSSLQINPNKPYVLNYLAYSG
jgi:Tetratricopeptide repeat.